MPYSRCSNGGWHNWLADAGVPGMWWCSHCGKRVWEKSELLDKSQKERDGE